MKYIFFILSLFIAISFLQSCEKVIGLTPDGKLDTARFTRHALDYVELPYGKHWIYKDSATANLDSVVLSSSKVDIIHVPARDLISGEISIGGSTSVAEHYSENFSLKLTKFVGTTQTEWFIGEATADIYPSGSYDTLPMILRASVPVYELAFSLSETSVPDYTITVEGVTYYNVVRTSTENPYSSPGSPDYYRTTFYWAKGVGIIKFEEIRLGAPYKTYTLLRHN